MENMKTPPTVTYYAAWPRRGGAATAVFRFYDDGIRCAERFTASEKRWVEDRALFGLRLSEDWGPEDELDEKQAHQIIEQLKAKGPVTR